MQPFVLGKENRERTVSAIVKMKRKLLGRRGDLILRRITTEYGCAEAGRLFDGQNQVTTGVRAENAKDVERYFCPTLVSMLTANWKPSGSSTLVCYRNPGSRTSLPSPLIFDCTSPGLMMTLLRRLDIYATCRTQRLFPVPMIA